ncbi:DUF2795 domain-containing protein [Streptomyces sp. NPDC020403]|uniref:DUF2795 domain-containing protein n=1 Tax=unclassified Streptomyces TaxID=2593676 RepID=UPI0033CC824A
MTDTNPIELQKALKGAEYPAARDDLVAVARDNGADDAFVDRLSHAKRARFDGPNDVQKAVFSDS